RYPAPGIGGRSAPVCEPRHTRVWNRQATAVSRKLLSGLAAKQKPRAEMARSLEILRHCGATAQSRRILVANDRYDGVCGGGNGGRNVIVHFSLVVAFGAIAASGLTLQALQSFFG